MLNNDQITFLRGVFFAHPSPPPEMCEQLSNTLSVKPEQISRWFSNQRSRERKKVERHGKRSSGGSGAGSSGSGGEMIDMGGDTDDEEDDMEDHEEDGGMMVGMGEAQHEEEVANGTTLDNSNNNDNSSNMNNNNSSNGSNTRHPHTHSSVHIAKRRKTNKHVPPDLLDDTGQSMNNNNNAQLQQLQQLQQQHEHQQLQATLDTPVATLQPLTSQTQGTSAELIPLTEHQAHPLPHSHPHPHSHSHSLHHHSLELEAQDAATKVVVDGMVVHHSAVQ